MPPTLAEVDEALGYARAVPAEERGAAWHSYVDGLLEQRRKLVGPSTEPHETRVMFSSEHR